MTASLVGGLVVGQAAGLAELAQQRRRACSYRPGHPRRGVAPAPAWAVLAVIAVSVLLTALQVVVTQKVRWTAVTASPAAATRPAALLRLAGAVLVEQHDKWQAGDRRYLSEASMTALTAAPDRNTALPATATLTAS